MLNWRIRRPFAEVLCPQSHLVLVLRPHRLRKQKALGTRMK